MSALLQDMLPEIPDFFDASTNDRRKSRWVFSLLPVDVRGKELGRAWIKAGVPACIKTRGYVRRSDSLDENASFLVTDEVLAGPAATELHQQYAERGLVIFEHLTGFDSDTDARWLGSFFGKVLPDPINFEQAEDPDWELFARRHAHLARLHAKLADGSRDQKTMQYLLDCNQQTWDFVKDQMGKLLAEAERARKPNGAGRTRPTDDELRMLKWCGMHPSRHFDGYQSTDQPTRMEMPPELVTLLATLAESRKDTSTDAMAQMMQMFQEQQSTIAAQEQRINELMALVTAPDAKKK